MDTTNIVLIVILVAIVVKVYRRQQQTPVVEMPVAESKPSGKFISDKELNKLLCNAAASGFEAGYAVSKTGLEYKIKSGIVHIGITRNGMWLNGHTWKHGQKVPGMKVGVRVKPQAQQLPPEPPPVDYSDADIPEWAR